MSPRPHIALMASLDLPAPDGAGGVPEWIHLLPATAGEIPTFDGRGPYRVEDVPAILARSLANPRGMPVDENHATDVAAKAGGSSPARGWIVDLEAREDGIWGRVEWTKTGRELVAERAYRGISPVLAIDAGDKRTVRAILRASLVNLPNLRGLAALNQETDDAMTDMDRIAEALGLGNGASADDMVAAIGTLRTGTALQSALTEIGTALGVEGAEPAAILAAARAARPADVVAALQSQIGELTGQLNALTEAAARDRAEAFVDGAIRAGRVGVKPLRDHYVTRHMADAAAVELEIGALPVLNGSRGAQAAPPAKPGEIALDEAHLAACRQIGIDPKDYIATLQRERAKEEL